VREYNLLCQAKDICSRCELIDLSTSKTYLYIVSKLSSYLFPFTEEKRKPFDYLDAFIQFIYSFLY